MSTNAAKRVRVSQACESCRARKTKCDGRHPICSSCSLMGQACSYDPSPKKRGLRAGHSGMLERRVRVLEMICALLVDRVKGSVNVIQSALTLGASSNAQYGVLALMLRGGERESEILLRNWRASAVSGWVESLVNELLSLRRKTEESQLQHASIS